MMLISVSPGPVQVPQPNAESNLTVCREDQIKTEVADLFDFMRSFYGMLGLTFKLKLSTRPDKYMGEIETWNAAEAMLKEALDEFSASSEGIAWELNAGDGAFYGPKIDIAVLVSFHNNTLTIEPC